MDDSIGSQPNRNVAGTVPLSSDDSKVPQRLTQRLLVDPIRKASSSRDLHHLGKDDYTSSTGTRLISPSSVYSTARFSPSSPHSSVSPVHDSSDEGNALRSRYQPPSSWHPPSMQSGTRRSTHEIAQSSSSTAGSSSYRRVTPTTSTYVAPTSGEWRRHDGQTGERSPVVGLGLSGADGRRLNETPSAQSSPTVRADVISTGSTRSAATQRSPAVMSTGLPSAYTHGAFHASDAAYAPRSGALSESLPSSMRFNKDGDSSRVPITRPLAFRREMKPFGGSPAFAQQQQQQQQQQATKPIATAPSMSPTLSGSSDRGSVIGASTASNRGRFSSALASSTPSPSSAYVPMHGRVASDGVTARSMHRHESSQASSEGHVSSPMFALAGTHGSASTSLTSLRDSSVYNKPRRPESIEPARPGSQSIHSRIPTASRSTMGSASQSEREKGKGRQMDPPSSAKSFTTDERSTVASPATSPADSYRIVGLPTAASTKRHGVHVDSTEDLKVADDRSNIRSGTLLPSSGTFAQALSPIAGSSPGNSFRSPSSAMRDAETQISSYQVHDVTLEDDLDPWRRGESVRNNENVITTSAATHDQPSTEPSRQQREEMDTLDAQRRFKLLQQLHLDELTAHAPEANGWLDAKNGCERVMIPRPALRGRSSYQNPDIEKPRSATAAAAFERNRRLPASFCYGTADPSRAQALLSDSQQLRRDHASLSHEQDRPLFHHRLPPNVPDAEQAWPSSAIPKERPEIPKRTSSRQGYHSRSRVLSDVDAAARTPALTPNLLSDDEDTFDTKTPDLATVIAQGRALDEEREKWREEHRRSIGASQYAAARRQRAKSTRDSAAHRVQLPEEQRQRREGEKTLRHARSSPNLRDRANLAHSTYLPPLPPPSPPVSRCLPPSRLFDDQGRLQRSRTRSKSMENLSRLGHSAIAFAAPCLLPSLEGKSGAETEKEATRRSSSSTRRRKGRSKTLSRHDHPLPSEKKVLYDQPYVITRQMIDEGTSPGIGQGPFVFRDAKQAVHHGEALPVQLPSVSQYGAAISTPRPNIGQGQVLSEVTFSPAGRHQTARGYHRPSNSDELASYLRQTRHGKDGGKEAPLGMPRKPVPILDELESEEDKRRWSLGMSRFIAESGSQDVNDPTPTSAGTITPSLPVPPRRPRSRLGPGGLTPTSSRVYSSDSDSADGKRKSNLPPPAESEQTRAALQGLTQAQLRLRESFMQPGQAFQTPPLRQPSHEGGFFSATTPTVRTISDKKQTSSDETTSTATATATVRRPMASTRSDQVALSSPFANPSHTSIPSAGRPSSEDSASVRSRELWNTDEHNEEAFSTLFFRRPSSRSRSRPTVEIISGTQDDEEQNTAFRSLMNSTLSIPHPDDVMQDEHGRRRSVGSQSAHDSVWNDSSIGDHRSPRHPTLHVSQDTDSLAVPHLPLPANVRVGRVDRQVEQVEARARLSERAQSGEEDNTVDEGGAGARSEVMTRKDAQTSAHSLLRPPSSTDVSRVSSEKDREIGGFISFSSPAAPPPLQLPPQEGQASGNVTSTSTATTTTLQVPQSSNRLTVSSSLSGRTDESSNSSGGDRRPAEAIMDLVRSRVWPTPPADTSSSRQGTLRGSGKQSDGKSGKQ